LTDCSLAVIFRSCSETGISKSDCGICGSRSRMKPSFRNSWVRD
jgi:hypothetical protein